MRIRAWRWLFACVMITAVSTATASIPRQFVPGYWFDGKEFARTSFYAVDGVLTKHRPREPVETVDLHRGYVVPAFGDAHNHFPSSRDNFSSSNRLLLGSGVFYVLNPNDIAERSNPIRTALRAPSSKAQKISTTRSSPGRISSCIFPGIGGRPRIRKENICSGTLISDLRAKEASPW